MTNREYELIMKMVDDLKAEIAELKQEIKVQDKEIGELNNTSQKYYYTAKEFAKKVGLSIDTVYSIVNEGNAITIKKGNRVYINFEATMKKLNATCFEFDE